MPAKKILVISSEVCLDELRLSPASVFLATDVHEACIVFDANKGRISKIVLDHRVPWWDKTSLECHCANFIQRLKKPINIPSQRVDIILICPEECDRCQNVLKVRSFEQASQAIKPIKPHFLVILGAKIIKACQWPKGRGR